MAKKTRFVDNSIAPIIAFDFDGTINVNGEANYPMCGEVRPHTREVIDFMSAVGIKIIVWSSRDVAYSQEDKMVYDHITPMINFLDNNDIKYDAINKSIQFVPYHYNSRKVYAHMYVDDRGFGWEDTDYVMYKVLESMLVCVVGIDAQYVHEICGDLVRGVRIGYHIANVKDVVKRWRSDCECTKVSW